MLSLLLCPLRRLHEQILTNPLGGGPCRELTFPDTALASVGLSFCLSYRTCCLHPALIFIPLLCFIENTPPSDRFSIHHSTREESERPFGAHARGKKNVHSLSPDYVFVYNRLDAVDVPCISTWFFWKVKNREHLSKYSGTSRHEHNSFQNTGRDPI